jgi:cytochrome c biogenesis factor
MITDNQNQSDKASIRPRNVERNSETRSVIIAVVISGFGTLIAVLIQLVSPFAQGTLANGFVLLVAIMATMILSTLAVYIIRVQQQKKEDQLIEAISQKDKDLLEEMTDEEIREFGGEKTAHHG